MTAAGVWHDDGQVVYKVAEKAYGFPERCEVQAWPVVVTVGAERAVA